MTDNEKDCIRSARSAVHLKRLADSNLAQEGACAFGTRGLLAYGLYQFSLGFINFALASRYRCRELSADLFMRKMESSAFNSVLGGELVADKRGISQSQLGSCELADCRYHLKQSATASFKNVKRPVNGIYSSYAMLESYIYNV